MVRFINQIWHAFRQTLFLFAFAISFWILAYLFYSTDFRYYYYAKTDSEFLQRFENYATTSLSALKQARLWLKHNKYYEKRVLFNQSNENSLCIGVLYKKRISIGNLYQPLVTITSLLTRIKLKYQDRVRISVINVENNTNNELDLIRGIIHIVPLSLNASLLKTISHYEKVKETYDYINTMKYYSENYNSTCKHVLLIEDDSVVCKDWYYKIQYALEYINKNGRKWYCLKLFTSFRYYDWVTHPFTLFMSILKIFGFYIFEYLVVTRLLYFYKSKINLIFAKLFLMANSILLIFFLNCASISPLGYGVKTFTLGFNAVANLYPMSVLDKLATFFYSNLQNFQQSFEPKDIVVKRFKNLYNYDEYILEPAMFQHLGLQSSMSYSKIDLNNIRNVQYSQRVFQSYSFMKEYNRETIEFDPNYWVS